MAPAAATSASDAPSMSTSSLTNAATFDVGSTTLESSLHRLDALHPPQQIQRCLVQAVAKPVTIVTAADCRRQKPMCSHHNRGGCRSVDQQRPSVTGIQSVR